MNYDEELHSAWVQQALQLAMDYREAEPGSEVRDAMRAMKTHFEGRPASMDAADAMDKVAPVVRAAGEELTSMRRCFEAADRERSELRDRAERAEAERDALRADAERYRYVLKHARRIDICGLSISQTSMCQLSARIDAERRNA